MPDPIPLVVVAPLAPVETKPPLTTAMVIEDKISGTSGPGAGGWVPSTTTIAAIGGLGVALGALTPVLPIPWNCISGALGGGLLYFAAKSAGPRSLS